MAYKHIFVLLAAFVVAGNASAGAVTDQIDRFTGKRMIDYTSDAQNLDTPILSFHVQVTKGEDPLISVKLIRVGSDWRYLNCHSVDWLIDGVPLSTAPAMHRGDVSRYGRTIAVTEFIGQPMTISDLNAIARGVRVEYRLCKDVYVLGAEEKFSAGQIRGLLLGVMAGPEPTIER